METQTTAPTEANAAAKRKKPNSPKAPGSTLRYAVAETTKLYGRYSHGTFSRGEMASALGMSANSGAFMGKAATLKDYGLVEEQAGQLRVTDLFKAIKSAPAGSAELKRNALQAITRSTVFASLLQQFSQKVPDETALALRLETSSGFNPDRARAVAGAFYTSLADFGLIDGNGNVLPVRDDGTAAAEAPQTAEERPDEAASIPAGPGLFRVEVPLGAGRRALLALPDDLADSDTRKICAVLAAYTAD